MSAENFEAFQSPNYPILAEAGVHIRYHDHAIAEPSNEDVFFREAICSDLASIKVFPGMKREVFQAIAGISGLKGLILETFGSGNAPTKDWMLEELDSLIIRGVVVVNITQCSTGQVIQGKYETSAHLERAGVVGGGDMTFEAALTKLMYLLACEEIPKEEVGKYMMHNLRGEIG